MVGDFRRVRLREGEGLQGPQAGVKTEASPLMEAADHLRSGRQQRNNRRDCNSLCRTHCSQLCTDRHAKLQLMPSIQTNRAKSVVYFNLRRRSSSSGGAGGGSGGSVGSIENGVNCIMERQRRQRPRRHRQRQRQRQRQLSVAAYNCSCRSRCCNYNHEPTASSKAKASAAPAHRLHNPTGEGAGAEAAWLSQAMQLANCSMLQQRSTGVIGSKLPKEAAADWSK